MRDMRTNPPYTSEVDIYNLHADSVEVSAKSYVIVGDNEPFKLDSDFYLNK